MLFREIERIGEPEVNNSAPAIYNLLKDPVTGVYWGVTEMCKDGMAIGY